MFGVNEVLEQLAESDSVHGMDMCCVGTQVTHKEDIECRGCG